ncbi:MAG TPA: chemotaxis protein CheB [Candidatus Angelobacter sp.]|nr:chemotaxis protein CheB [Candidatus Angelobacter sp.]
MPVPSASGSAQVQHPPPSTFPIVGVGASAGGLEAFSQLLSALPNDLGMAFVLVPHLDPLHESAMTELLARQTKMSVLTVLDGMRVAPNRVYVIPPNTEMTIADSVLRLVTRKRGEHAMPIDAFFRSLAEAHGSNAIGVVLSGTASDGTLGVTAIKNEGGITFAQDSKTAKYDGMPSSAIATGCIDFVLPPSGIAAELVNIRRHPYMLQPRDVAVEVLPEESDGELPQLFRFLRQASKVDFSEYKPATVRRRILRRMALKKIDNLRDYIRYLREHQPEADALYQDILINVTSFFRNPEAFDALKEIAYPEIFKNRGPNDTVRVWVPGCSTGEEAYSHAISLVEYLSDIRADVSLQVFGTDLSEAAVQKARAGIFKESIASDISTTRLRRFFNKVEEGYQISKSIRDVCIFARQNVFSDPPFSQMDIVSCRNLLIYLGPALQRRVIPIFHYALKQNGYLMVGSTEGLVGNGSDLFEIVDKKNRIFTRKAVPSPVSFGFSMEQFESWGRNMPAREHREADAQKLPETLQKETERLLLARYSPPAVVVNEKLDILQTRGHTGSYLELSPGKASLNLLRMARPGLLFELQKAMEAARKSGAPVVRERLQVESNGNMESISLEVVPFRVAQASEPMFLIVFNDNRTGQANVSTAEARPPKARPESESARDRQIQQLKQELAATKEYLQSIIEEREATNEELQAANEEIQSANEELQSTNEELQTSKEELESANEELNTVNEEMQHRNQQLSQLTNDLTNLLNSVNMPIVMLGPDLSVRRFTMQAEKVLGLSAIDVGRPIGNVKLRLDIRDLEHVALDVIHEMVPQQVNINDERGTAHIVRLTPYRTSDNKIEGVVLTMADMHESK